MSEKNKDIKPKFSKTKEKQKSVNFSQSEGQEGMSFGLQDIVDQTRGNLSDPNAVARSTLAKSVKPLLVKKDYTKKNSESKIIFSSKILNEISESVEHKGFKRLSDDELRQIAQVDPYISSIISTRCSQGSVIGRLSESKFDKGTRVREKKALNREDFDSTEEFDEARNHRQYQIDSILSFFMNCGTTDAEDLDNIFSNSREQIFKHCTLADFMSAQIRNILTFGRCATHLVRNEEGNVIAFRPAPVETIYNVKEGGDVHLHENPETISQSIEDADEYNDIPNKARPYAYVQRVDGKNVNFFTEDDLIVTHFQKQALWDLRGYPLSPIEMAIYMVFIHQNTLQYLRNQFVKGMGTKGALSLEVTQEGASLSAEDIDELRDEFHNFLSRTDNSAATPIISGPIRVNWIPLTGSPRDMEFLQVEEHVIRALCSSFQTSPQEMGYGHLSINQGGLTSANKQEDIVRGEERGLRMILDTIYDLLNGILYDNFPKAEEFYSITYTGVGEDTKDAVIQRHSMELQTTATMGSLWADSEKSEPLPSGADVPLSPLFHQNVVRYMKYGQFMEDFFGKEGWSKKPEYDFLIDPTLNSAYQQLKTMPVDVQQEQTMLGLKMQEQQAQQMEQQAAQMEQMQQQQGQAQMLQQDQQGQEAQPEEAEKSSSLADIYRQTLQKSLSGYFEHWSRIHKQDEE